MNPFFFPAMRIGVSLIFFLLGCGAPVSQQNQLTGNTDKSTKSGAEIFQKNCILCHGASGKLGLNGAKDLSLSQLPIQDRVNIITYGKNLMTPFGEQLSPAEIDSVARYTFTLAKQPEK